jgi:magnesium chelatase accessory protein
MSEEYDVGMPEATLLSGFDARDVSTGGSRVRVYVAGEGPSIVLVHGLGGAATNWSVLAPLLAVRHRVLVIDLPGHGRSAPAPAPDGLGSLADVVADLARCEGMLPAVFVGHSMGADVVVRLALRRRDAVQGIVVVSAGALACSRLVVRTWLRVWGILRLSRIGGRYRLAFARRARLRRLAFGGWGVWDPASLSPGAALGFLDGPANARDTGTAREALIADDLRPALDGVECPALVLWGARDRSTPLEDGFEYARRLRAPIRALAAAGHLVIAERPAECAALIEEFLDRVREIDVLPRDAETPGDALGERLHA